MANWIDSWVRLTRLSKKNFLFLLTAQVYITIQHKWEANWQWTPIKTTTNVDKRLQIINCICLAIGLWLLFFFFHSPRMLCMCIVFPRQKQIKHTRLTVPIGWWQWIVCTQTCTQRGVLWLGKSWSSTKAHANHFERRKCYSPDSAANFPLFQSPSIRVEDISNLTR